MTRQIIYPILFVLISLCSCTHSQHWNTIKDVESYIEERPDKALSALQAVSTSELKGKREHALHSLMISMAMDKNYIDRSDFDALQPALDYYLSHGPDKYTFLTYYYAGVINMNAGASEEAMECFVNAERYAGSATNIQKARLYVAQANLYGDSFRYDEAVQSCHLASMAYFTEGDSVRYAKSLCNEVLFYTGKRDRKEARHCLDTIEQLIPILPTERLANYYGVHLAYDEFFDVDSIPITLEQYLANIPDEYINWLEIAEAYRMSSLYKEALSALDKYRSFNAGYDSSAAYHIINARACEASGDFEGSTASWHRYTDLVDEKNLGIVRSETGFIKERMMKEMEILKKKNSILLLVILLIAAIISGFILLRLFAKRLIDKIHDNKKLSEINRNLSTNIKTASEEREYYKDLYDSIKIEKDALERLQLEAGQSAPNELVKERAVILNSLAGSMLSTAISEHEAVERLQVLIEDRNRFIKSTTESIAISHPAFMKKLKSAGLNDTEIGVCCLFGIGLNGMEVSAYLGKKAIYNITSGIRKKLSISRSETNLDIFIRKEMN